MGAAAVRLFDYPFCMSRCNIYLEKLRNHDIFKVVVVALRQIQDGGDGGSHAGASSKFKIHVVASPSYELM